MLPSRDTAGVIWNPRSPANGVTSIEANVVPVLFRWNAARPTAKNKVENAVPVANTLRQRFLLHPLFLGTGGVAAELCFADSPLSAMPINRYPFLATVSIRRVLLAESLNPPRRRATALFKP